jgi:hypothetical protein
MTHQLLRTTLRYTVLRHPNPRISTSLTEQNRVKSIQLSLRDIHPYRLGYWRQARNLKSLSCTQPCINLLKTDDESPRVRFKAVALISRL